MGLRWPGLRKMGEHAGSVLVLGLSKKKHEKLWFFLGCGGLVVCVMEKIKIRKGGEEDV